MRDGGQPVAQPRSERPGGSNALPKMTAEPVAPRRASGQLLLQRGVGHGQQDQVDRLGQVGQRRAAAGAADVGVPRVDQVGARPGGLRATSRDHPLAEAARPRAGADQGHAARLQHRPDGLVGLRRSGVCVCGGQGGAVTGGAGRRMRGPTDGGPAERPAATALAVGDRGPGRLPAGDAAHAAARVGGGAGVVQAGDGRPVVRVAGRRAHVEQLLQGQLAVEDVAADQAVLVLHLVGADDVAVQDRRLEVRRQLVVAVDHPVGVGLELLRCAAPRSSPPAPTG